MSESLLLILVILRHAPGWKFPLDIHKASEGKLILGMIPMHCGTLEDQGYITSRLQVGEERLPGRMARRMYAITPRGRQRLIEAEYESRHPDGAKPAT